MAQIILTGQKLDTSDATAKSDNILLGKTAYADGDKITGTIASKAAATITPTTSNQTIAAGQYLSGAQTIKGDANLATANIKKGVSIFGVSGKSSVVDTTDATATAANILLGKTAYVNGNKVTGTKKEMPLNSIVMGFSRQCRYGGEIIGDIYDLEFSLITITLSMSSSFVMRSHKIANNPWQDSFYIHKKGDTTILSDIGTPHCLINSSGFVVAIINVTYNVNNYASIPSGWQCLIVPKHSVKYCNCRYSSDNFYDLDTGAIVTI